MLVCGVLIAIFGLLIAVLRTLRGPIFFPVRVGTGGAVRPGLEAAMRWSSRR